MSTCLCCQPMGRRLLAAALAAAAASPALAQAPSAGAPDPALLDDIVAADRILSDQGVIDGFGHVSVRHNLAPDRHLLARGMAPALVTRDDIIDHDLDSNPLNAGGRVSYLERFIHGEIHKARPDVMAVVHGHSPAVPPFADTGLALRPMNHIAGILGGGAPVFEIRGTGGLSTDMLIRNAALGKALAKTLGGRPVALPRGHRSVTAAQSIRQVVFRAIYTEVNARAHADAMKIGTPIFLNAEEAAAAMKTNDALVERPWALWKQRAMGTRQRVVRRRLPRTVRPVRHIPVSGRCHAG